MLDGFEDYQRCIHVLNRNLDLSWPKYIKSTMERYMLSVLYNQNDACWCTSDSRSQCVSRQGVDHQSRNILSTSSGELKRDNFQTFHVNKVLMQCHLKGAAEDVPSAFVDTMQVTAMQCLVFLFADIYRGNDVIMYCGWHLSVTNGRSVCSGLPLAALCTL